MTVITLMQGKKNIKVLLYISEEILSYEKKTHRSTSREALLFNVLMCDV